MPQLPFPVRPVGDGPVGESVDAVVEGGDVGREELRLFGQPVVVDQAGRIVVTVVHSEVSLDGVVWDVDTRLSGPW